MLRAGSVVLLAGMLCAAPNTVGGQAANSGSRGSANTAREQARKLRSAALELAQRHAQQLEQQLTRQRGSGQRGSGETQRRLVIVKNYTNAFEAELRARDEIDAYQERCRVEQLSGKEHVEHLLAQESVVRKAEESMAACRREYRTLCREALPDYTRLALARLKSGKEP